MAKPDMTSAEFVKSGLQLRGGESRRVDYKEELLAQLRLAELPEPKADLKFSEERKWRFDFYYDSPAKIAIEYEGGIFDQGASGHTSVSGILRDIEKYNEAALAGWTVIRVTAQSVTSGAAVRYIKRALEKYAKSGPASDILRRQQGFQMLKALDGIRRTIRRDYDLDETK